MKVGTGLAWEQILRAWRQDAGETPATRTVVDICGRDLFGFVMEVVT